MAKSAEATRRAFFGEGLFDWQLPTGPGRPAWDRFAFDLENWWGTFPRNEAAAVPGSGADSEFFQQFPWAIGPFTKYQANPVLAPSPGKWDRGRYDGGVHNGA